MLLDDFDTRINADNYAKKKNGFDLIAPNDSLLTPDKYPESPYELDADKVKAYITQKLREFGERLKMHEGSSEICSGGKKCRCLYQTWNDSIDRELQELNNSEVK